MENRIRETAGDATGGASSGRGPAVSASTDPAVRDIAHGYPVVELEPEGKRPIRKGWQKDPITSGPAWTESQHAGNHGVLLRASDRLLLVDVDVKGGKDGPDAFRRLVEASGLDPSTFPAQRTPSGGFHLLGRIPEDYPADALPNGAVAPGLDILRDRKQFVRSPGSTPTGEYTEVRPLPPVEALPEWPTAFLDLLRSSSNGSRPAPPQEDLRAPSVGWVQEAVRKIENDDRFETRDAWLKVGAAIRAAVGPENVEDGHRIFQEFSKRWQDGPYDPDATEKTYRTLTPPYEVGFRYLAELAGDAGAVAAEAFQADPDAIPADPSGADTGNLVARFAEPLEEIEYTGPPGFLLDRLVLANDINFLAGEDGSYKTTAAIAIAAAVASGAPVHGHENPNGPKRVLYISEEDDADQIKNKADAIAAGSGMEIPAGHLEVMALRGFSFTSERWQKDLRAYAREGGYGLVVFDPLAEMLEGKENSNDDARPVVKFLRSITARRGPAVMVVHHAGKSAEGKSKVERYMRGASAFKAGARCIFGVSKTGDGFLLDPLKLSRIATPAATDVTVEIETDPADEHGIRWASATFEGAPRWKVEKEAAERAIRTTLLEAGTLNSTELQKQVSAVGHKPPVVTKARKALHGRGVITFDRGDHNAKLWRLVSPGDEFGSPDEYEDLTDEH